MSENERLAFLRDASDLTLQQYELAKRNAAANLSKELRVLLNQIIDELVEAELARRVREVRAMLTSDAQRDRDDFLFGQK